MTEQTLRRANPAAWNQISQELEQLSELASRRQVQWRKWEVARRLHELALLIDLQWEADEIAADEELLETVEWAAVERHRQGRREVGE